MRVYLDASVLVSLLTTDALTARADRFLRSRTPFVVLSDFAAAEFASALARRVRIKDMAAEEARLAFAAFDEWASQGVQRVETTPADIKAAEAALRRLDLTLRTPDALNIVIARRIDASLATFDDKMAASARALGLDVVTT